MTTVAAHTACRSRAIVQYADAPSSANILGHFHDQLLIFQLKLLVCRVEQQLHLMCSFDRKLLRHRLQMCKSFVHRHRSSRFLLLLFLFFFLFLLLHFTPSHQQSSCQHSTAAMQQHAKLQPNIHTRESARKREKERARAHATNNTHAHYQTGLIAPPAHPARTGLSFFWSFLPPRIGLIFSSPVILQSFSTSSTYTGFWDHGTNLPLDIASARMAV